MLSSRLTYNWECKCCTGFHVLFCFLSVNFEENCLNDYSVVRTACSVLSLSRWSWIHCSPLREIICFLCNTFYCVQIMQHWCTSLLVNYVVYFKYDKKIMFPENADLMCLWLGCPLCLQPILGRVLSMCCA